MRPFRRALVVVAHPDDAEFGAAGTIARWVQMGTDVRYLVLTDGASGSADPQMTRERLVAMRAAEQEDACTRLGVSDITMLGYRDGYLEPTVEARRKVAAEIRRLRPEAVLTLDPELRWSRSGYVNHPDHRAAGDLVLHAINPAASTRLWDPTLIDEGLEPWDVAELWLTSFGDGPDVVDVTGTFAAKVAALRCHASQLGDWDPEPWLRRQASDRGEQVGVELAEAFTVLRLRVLVDEGSEPVDSQPPINPTPPR
ncbi:MAG TPA: PIG-L deacetylase family protein [Egibacteraceae bacterium]|nr:PIG-L deacetylase family protein [Egibacteraceae bacterium]